MSAPGWLVVGAPVALFTPGRMSDAGTIKKAEITKIGKRDVVLSDGTRLNVNRLRISRGTWASDTELLPADHPRIAKARVANRITHTVSAIRRTTEAIDRAATRAQAAEVAALAEEMVVLAAAFVELHANLETHG